MISPQELLEASTQSISDKENAVKLCPYKRINTKQGYSFITLHRRKAKKISASIELDVDWDRDEDLGFLKKVNCSINTQEKIKGNYCILYQDVIIFVSEFTSYTESMKQYQYKGMAVGIDKMPLIDSLNDNETFGYSCLDLVCQMDNYNILPEFLALELDLLQQGIFLVKVEDSESVDMITQTNGKLEQIKKDNINIRCINSSRTDVMKFIVNLLEFGKQYDLFGLIGDYQITEINNYDNYSNLRGIRYNISITLCYNISTIIEYKEKKISIIMFKTKES